MSPPSQINQPSPSEADRGGGPESPTKPGVYWFQSESTSRALMVNVRLKDGKLSVWWSNQDLQPSL